MSFAGRVKFRRPVTEESIDDASRRITDSVITEALITSVENPGLCATQVLGNDVSKRKLLAYAQRFGLPPNNNGVPWNSGELCEALKSLVVMPPNREELEKSLRNFAKWWSRADRLPTLEQARALIRTLPGGSDVDKPRRSSQAWQGPFCGPAGGAPPGTFPASNYWQTRADEREPMISFAPNPDGIVACAERIGRTGDRSRQVSPGKKRGPSGRKPNFARDLSRPRWQTYAGRANVADPYGFNVPDAPLLGVETKPAEDSLEALLFSTGVQQKAQEKAQSMADSVEAAMQQVLEQPSVQRSLMKKQGRRRKPGLSPSKRKQRQQLVRQAKELQGLADEWPGL